MHQLTTLQFAALIGISLLEESVGGLLGHVEGLHHGLQFVNINGAITIVVLKEISYLYWIIVMLEFNNKYTNIVSTKIGWTQLKPRIRCNM